MPRNFAIRLSCPRGDSDSWVTLTDRNESLEQVLDQSWEFKCREHGSQQGIPREVIEIAPLDAAPSQIGRSISRAIAGPTKKIRRSSVRMAMRLPVVVYGFAGKSGAFHEETETVTVNASGALVILKTKLELGETVFLIHKASRAEQEVRVVYVDRYSNRETRVGLAFRQSVSDFWKKNRKEPRIPKSIQVIVKGTDSKGHPFAQTAYTVDLSQDGARLDGIGFLTAPGQTIEVRRLWSLRKARFRVVWIGQVGTSESNHVGVFGLQRDKNPWRVKLPAAATSAPDAKKRPQKK
jgi:hypothetical protein